MNKNFDLNLYLVTDAPERCRYGLLETVRRAVAGGVSIVQYRRENSDHATMLAEVLPLRDFLRGAGAIRLQSEAQLCCCGMNHH